MAAILIAAIFFVVKSDFIIFAGMKKYGCIGIVVLLALVACHAPTREAKRMIARAERLADTLPDSTARLIDSVLRMPANLSERQRMDMALLQAEALFGDRGNEISPVMDDDFFDDKPSLFTSPDLERGAVYYASKKQYAKAAHAALYCGFVQQHYDEKETAMRSFKEAERYGGMVQDSFTVALAEYRMGKMLYDDYMEDEAISMLKASDMYFGVHFGERAFVQNLKAAAYMIMKEFDSADSCLKESLAYAEQSQSSKAERKALNNYAVYYRLQGNHAQAITCLREIASEPGLTDTEKTLLYLNFGKTFAAMEATDSAAVYYKYVEEFLRVANIKDETEASAYGALSRFAESQGDAASALQYFKAHENLELEILSSYEKKSVFRIQQQYDYESVQNEMNKALIQRQHVITFFGIMTIIGLGALAISQIRLAKTRKQEAEAKTSLFHFMQQNKELAQRNKEQNQNQIYLIQKHRESEQAYEDLYKEKEELEQTAAKYGDRLSLALKKEQSVMLRLHLFLENQGDEELLKKLEKSVFGKQTHMNAMMETVDCLYPQLREIVKQEDLGLDENEQMDVIMSYINISRQDEALLLDKTTDMVDKIRNRSRKKIQSASERNQLPKIM